MSVEQAISVTQASRDRKSEIMQFAVATTRPRPRPSVRRLLVQPAGVANAPPLDRRRRKSVSGTSLDGSSDELRTTASDVRPTWLRLAQRCKAPAIRGRGQSGRSMKRGGKRACLAEAEGQSDIGHR
jgi:hypothetical protein